MQWAGVGVRPSDTKIRLGLFRAQKSPELAAQAAAAGPIGVGLAQQIEANLLWSAWTDPEDDVVDFHRGAFFGELSLVGQEMPPGSQNVFSGLVKGIRSLFGGEAAAEKQPNAKL